MPQTIVLSVKVARIHVAQFLTVLFDFVRLIGLEEESYSERASRKSNQTIPRFY